jgi:hypothetical protein
MIRDRPNSSPSPLPLPIPLPLKLFLGPLCKEALVELVDNRTVG